MTDRFKQAYTALTYAFYNKQLIYTDCSACAVGNIVAFANGYTIKELHYGDLCWFDNNVKLDDVEWSKVINIGQGKLYQSGPRKEAMAEVLPTGYSLKELALIEQKYGDLESYNKVNGPTTTPSIITQLLNFIAGLDGFQIEINKKFYADTPEAALSLIN